MHFSWQSLLKISIETVGGGDGGWETCDGQDYLSRLEKECMHGARWCLEITSTFLSGANVFVWCLFLFSLQSATKCRRGVHRKSFQGNFQT